MRREHPFRRHAAPWGAIVLLACWATAASAGDADARIAVGQLLDAGWEGSFQSRAEVDQQFEALPAPLRGDAQVRYALALVKIKQRRYTEALADLDSLSAADAASLRVSKMRVWLLTMLKQYDAALAESVRLAELAAAGDDASKAQSLEVVRFLGRIYGFLEGPAGDAALAPARQRHERLLAARLSDEQKTVFDEGRGALLLAFLDFTDEKVDARRAALAAAEEERMRTLRDVAATRQDIADRDRELQEQDQKLREQRQKELQRLASQDEPLAIDIGRLDAQARVVNRELSLLAAEIADLRARARREKDPDQQHILYREASRLSLLAARYDADLIALEGQAAVIAAKRAQLRRQQQEIEAQFSGQLDVIGKERSVLRRRERRADIDEKNAAGPNTGNSRRVRALSAQTQAFTTYEPFPLEEEKRRLLDALP